MVLDSNKIYFEAASTEVDFDPLPKMTLRKNTASPVFFLKKK